MAPTLGLDAQAIRGVLAAGVGGLLLLGNSVPADLAGQVRTADAMAAGGIPLLVMADQEGGGVQRLAGLVAPMPWARQMAATMTTAAVQALATRVGAQMRAQGVNVDLAPVLDVDAGAGPSSRDADGLRSFSGQAPVVARYGEAFLRGIQAGGVLPVVKHFPGLGGATGNTDNGPAQTPPLPELLAAGLVPFAAAIAAGAPAVMVSNASVPGLTRLPASLSPQVIGHLLAGVLGFRGLVLTDSLSAGAVQAAGYDVPDAAAAAVQAGADMVLFGSTLDAHQTAMLSPADVAGSVGRIVRSVVTLVGLHRLAVARLDEAVAKVLAAKRVSLCGRP